jgi:chromosome segregation ATPase
MQIRAIRLRNVKKIGPDGLCIESIDAGLNVLSEPNEFGKSTIFEALRHGLLTKHSSKSKGANGIEALRPNISGAAPEIEIDIQHADGQFRLFKRFLSKAETNLTDLTTGRVIGGDDAQDKLKELLGVEGKNSGATGLLWVSQGDSLKKPSQSNEDQEVFSGVLDNEVSSMISGRKGRDVFARAEKELEALVSLKTLKPMRAFKAALNEQSELQAACVKLEAEYREVERDLLDLADIERQISQWKNDDSVSGLKKELATYEDNKDKALVSESEKSTLKAKKAVAESEYQSAERVLSETAKQIEEAREIDVKLGRSDGEHTALTKLIDQKQKERGETSKQLESLQGQVKALRANYELAKDAVRIKQARETLKQKTSDLDIAKAKHQDLLKLAEKVERLKIDNLVLREIEQADGELKTATELLKSSQVTARVNYAPGNSVKFKTSDLGEIEDGASLPVKDRLVLEMDSIASVEVINPLSAEGDTQERFDAAEIALESLLSKYGLSSIAEARKLEKERFAVKLERDNIEKEILSYAPKGIDKLEENIALLKSQIGDVGQTKGSVEEAKELLDKSLDEEMQLKGELTAIDAFIQEKINGRTGIESASTIYKENRSELAAELGPVDSFDKKLDDLRATLAEQKSNFDKAVSELAAFEKSMPNMESIKSGIDRITQAIANNSKRRKDLDGRQIALKERLSLRFQDGVEEALDNVRGELEAATRQVAAFEAEAEALKLLRETLVECQMSEKQKLFEPVIREIGPLARQVIPGIEFEFGEDFAASDIIRNGVKETIESLSGGTQEQIAVLTRLVFARLKAKQGYPTPVILDDALVFSDDYRISEMFDALNTVAKDVQVIVLTCRQKSFQGLGGNILSTKEWNN